MLSAMLDAESIPTCTTCHVMIDHADLFTCLFWFACEIFPKSSCVESLVSIAAVFRVSDPSLWG